MKMHNFSQVLFIEQELRLKRSMSKLTRSMIIYFLDMSSTVWSIYPVCLVKYFLCTYF